MTTPLQRVRPRSKSKPRPSPKPFRLTCRELARRAKLPDGRSISYAYVSQCLNGVRRPSIDVAAAMARALGLTMDEFYRRLRVSVPFDKGVKAHTTAKRSRKAKKKGVSIR